MIDWDDAFDNSGYVGGSKNIIAAWAADAAIFRQSSGFEEIEYGDHRRERADVFTPTSPPNGTVVFLHGGYWHLLDKSFVSHFARGPLLRGRRVIVPSYPLAPDVCISEISKSALRVCTWAAKTFDEDVSLIGHSAGGHLAARVATLNGPITRAVSVSGVHDLRPLLHTHMNNTLKLTETEASAESIALLPEPELPVTFWVGSGERPEFLRQCRSAGEAWPTAREVYEPGRHHFDIIDSLRDPEGALTKEVCGDVT